MYDAVMAAIFTRARKELIATHTNDADIPGWIEGGFAVSMAKPPSEPARKPWRVQTGFREAKRTIAVAPLLRHRSE